MYIDVDAIKNIAALITAIGVIGTAVVTACSWYLKQKNLSKRIDCLETEQKNEIKTLREEHANDIRKIEEEACIHTYGILACLKGLQEKGCNGPVTEAIDKIEKYINKKAHEQKE